MKNLELYRVSPDTNWGRSWWTRSPVYHDCDITWIKLWPTRWVIVYQHDRRGCKWFKHLK